MHIQGGRGAAEALNWLRQINKALGILTAKQRYHTKSGAVGSPQKRTLGFTLGTAVGRSRAGAGVDGIENERRAIVDVTLGPWKAESVDDKTLAEAMGDQAWKTVEKADGFTPRKDPHGKLAKSGFTISGRLTSVVKMGGTTHVFSTFTIWVDGTMSNVPPVEGNGLAEGSNTAEDASRAITEARINKILGVIKTGRVVKAG